MTSPAVPRPPRVASACLFLGMSCVIVLTFLLSWISGWGSMQVQKDVRTTFNITDIPGWLDQGLLAGAAVAAAGVVFAVFAFQGHQPSRIILTVYAGVLSLVFLSQGTFGVFPAVFAIACGIYLWTAEARRWFGIKNGTIAPPEPAPRPDPYAVPVAPPVHEAIAPVESPQPSAQVPTAPLSGASTRPQNVLAAGLIAIIMSGLVAFISGINVLFYILAKGEYLRAFRESKMLQDKVKETGMSIEGVASALFIICAVMAVAALLGIIAGAFVLAGNPLARTVLVVLSVPTAAISLIAVPFGLLWAGASIATIVLLRRPESRAWFESRGKSRTS